MLKQMEGSQAIAEAVALCRPEVICAYPITPQTHIVEGLGEMVKSGELQNCEFINVESEFAALSVAIGSSAAGARSYVYKLLADAFSYPTDEFSQSLGSGDWSRQLAALGRGGMGAVERRGGIEIHAIGNFD